MHPLNRTELYSLEEYAQQREEFRKKVIRHKQTRCVNLGPNATLYFEDRLTMQYQIQEMLRIERIFEAEAIEEELQTYNPLIPNGSNWKATFMLEYGSETERKKKLAELIGIEETVWIQVEDFEKVFPICNEDLSRSNEEKTSAVHFMRFELDDVMREALKNNSSLSMGIDHPAYSVNNLSIPAVIKQSLTEDLR